MSKPWQQISNERLKCPPSAKVGSLHISCDYLGNGDFGPTGPTGAPGSIGVTGSFWSDYLFWNDATYTWDVGSNKVHLGQNAGQFNQEANTVAIGNLAGNTDQQQYSVAIGRQSGRYRQQSQAVAIGNVAGNTDQKTHGIAIGGNAGANNQGQHSVAIGRQAGGDNQRDHSIAIGREAGKTDQGTHSIAIGRQAGYIGQHDNTIVLNASGSALDTQATDAFYVKPIRGRTGFNSLYYDNNTGEITYSPPYYMKHHATVNIDDPFVYNQIYSLTDGISIEIGKYIVNFYFQANGTIKDGSASNANLKYLNYNLSTSNSGFTGPIGESRVISQVKLSDKAGPAELSYNCSRVLVNDTTRDFYLVFQMDFTNLSAANDTDPGFQVQPKSYCELVKIA
jgi:hypothetical protein